MSTPAESALAGDDLPLQALPLDDERGTHGMWLCILTETLLFVSMFFAYFFIGHRNRHWPASPPERKLALVLLAILAGSSVVVWAAEKLLAHGRRRAARVAIWLTVAAGGLFLWVQTLEYRSHLQELWPTDDAYASLFYAITSLHGLHVVVGLLMLIYVGLLPRLEPNDRPPHRPLHNAALYWHFVDVVWLFVVALLYLLPYATPGVGR